MRITGGPSRGRKLTRIDNANTRPPLGRLRQSIFSILDDRVEGSLGLDLYAGSGALGIEALSRGARGMIFVESDRDTARALERSLATLGFRAQSHVFQADAIEACHVDEFLRTRTPELERGPLGRRLGSGQLDLVFLDPPFAHLEPGEERVKLLEGVRTLRASSRLDPEGLVILRAPREHPAFGEDEPASRSRPRGRSTVHYLEPLPPESAPDRGPPAS